MKQWYQCPSCGAPVAFGSRFCTNCGMQLNWQPQQQAQPPPAYQQPQQQWNYGYRQPGKEPKKTSSWLIGCLGLMVGIALLVGGILTVISDLQKAPPTAPPATSQPTDTSPAPAETLPEYIKQYENRQPQVIGSHGNTPYLSNDSGATDVSFAALKSFILEDATDDGVYLLGVRDCVDFAEQLHNNAERAGIKAAYVSVHFVGEEIGHALNAFKTTDKGLVYIDCTGQGFQSVTPRQYLHEKTYPCERDRVAYVEIDKELGAISIDCVTSLQYSFYIEYTQKSLQYDRMLEDYNNEVVRYNQKAREKIYYIGSSELAALEAWKVELIKKEQTLDELGSQLGNCLFESLGIVETVEIYW